MISRALALELELDDRMERLLGRYEHEAYSLPARANELGRDFPDVRTRAADEVEVPRLPLYACREVLRDPGALDPEDARDRAEAALEVYVALSPILVKAELARLRVGEPDPVPLPAAQKRGGQFLRAGARALEQRLPISAGENVGADGDDPLDERRGNLSLTHAPEYRTAAPN